MITDHVKKGFVRSYKPVDLKNGTKKYITTFAIENDEYVGGTEYVTLWIHKQPYCNQEWYLMYWNYKYTACDPVEQ